MSKSPKKQAKKVIKSMGLVESDGNPRFSLEIEKETDKMPMCPECGKSLTQQSPRQNRYNCLNESCNVVTVVYSRKGQIRRITRTATFLPKIVRPSPKSITYAIHETTSQ